MREKYTKKATAKIISEVLKIDPKASKLTSLDQAFVILMTHWDMELSVGLTNKITSCSLYRNEEVVYEWLFDQSVQVWMDNMGDWDWNIIYKTVLEDIIKNKLYKPAKKRKKNKQ